MNCGPGGTWLEGTWDLQLGVLSWCVWCWVAGELVSFTSDVHSWAELPDAVLAVCVYHEHGRRTFMWYVDGYPSPPGVGGETKRGVQIGDVHSDEWSAVRDTIKSEA